MDVESRARWVEYSMAKDEMFAYTDLKGRPGSSWTQTTRSARG